MKGFKKYSPILKGILMGTCDIIPGVSGGTIAFITGIYDRLIDALHSFNLTNLKLLFQGNSKQARKNIDGRFLVMLFGGIGIAILSLSRILSYGLEQYPQHIWAFFFGLILASAYLMRKYIKQRNFLIILLLILGLLTGYVLSNLQPIAIGTANITMFISGAIAIIAMILPGISGSYILLILGQYSILLGYITNLTHGDTTGIIPILHFIVGAILGLLAFSKLLHRVKNNYHDQMVGLLIGIMLGSLNKLRPWKATIQTYIDRHGQEKALITKNLIPTINQDFWILLAIMIGGIAIVLGIEYFAKKLQK
ncbi:MAG: DUF368 domain-containing protein [candidate division SR1 bacterium]|nr:MAG: DUF368 domain-containing protein [candidate division SR1 bacterium]